MKIIIVMLALLSIEAMSKSLYNESTYESLTSTVKASKIGDLITVVIYESATASASADADAQTSSSVGLNASDGSTDLGALLGLSSDFNGGGAVNRSGKIAANISVMITSISDSGLLEVNGMQEILLNNELQMIKISGFVRSSDINEENTVYSPKIANSKIEFIGEGMLSNSEKPGWITRFFQWIF